MRVAKSSYERDKKCRSGTKTIPSRPSHPSLHVLNPPLFLSLTWLELVAKLPFWYQASDDASLLLFFLGHE
jgi:hypothetical protein